MQRAVPPGFRRKVEMVAIGASAGGVDALLVLLDGLKAPMRAAIVVVLHLPEDHQSRLPEVFAHRLGLPVREPQAGEPVSAGTVYFAPAGYHLLVEADRSFSLSCDSPVLFSRPSIDVLLESCADVYGSQLAGFVLTGANEDGARGLAAVRAAGGLTAVQDPAQAAHPTMPQAALAAGEPDFVLPLAGLQGLLHTVTCR